MPAAWREQGPRRRLRSVHHPKVRPQLLPLLMLLSALCCSSVDTSPSAPESTVWRQTLNTTKTARAGAQELAPKQRRFPGNNCTELSAVLKHTVGIQ